MNRLEFTEPARADLQQIQDYIAQRNIQAATRWTDTLEATCRKLAEMPGMGRHREELAPGLRSFPVASYLIFYRLLDDDIQVLRVLHGARDLRSPF